MSLEGTAAGKLLKGRINSVDMLTISAYGIAVKNGFEGTEEEWLASLKGEKGDKGDVGVFTLDGEKTNLVMDGYKVTDLGNPTEDGDAVSKKYVDARTLLAEDPNNDGNIVLQYGGDVVPGGGGSGGSGGGSGITDAEKALILTLFKNAAYTSADMGAVLTQLETLWADNGGSDDPGGDTEATLSSISATYSGGDVAVGTAVSDLTGIVVTAHYSDGTSATVTGYTLSGTIAEGSNTITVSYGGKTTTFTVNGVAEESKAVNLMTTGDLGTFADLSVYTGYDGYYNADAKTLQLTPKSAGSNTNAHLKITPFVETGKTYTLFLGVENRKANNMLSNSGKVDYSKASSFQTNNLSVVTPTANIRDFTGKYQYIQFTVPADAVEVYLMIVTNERTSTTVTNVALYEGAYTEMP